MRKWIPLMMLASAQFVMVLDTSVMNVAISQIVEDLDTTIQGVQTAITMYTLVMAAFMLLGAKLGDILGRNRAFAIGLAIYGAGSLTTALSPNLAVLLIGWSGIEGFGAVLVIPAIAALTAASYEGRERALAYALLGGVAAIAVAAGPLIGGWVTTEFSWRYVFAAETVVVIIILLLRGQIPRAAAAERRPQLDIVGVALSASGLGLIVFAILRSSVWGFVQPRTPPTIDGTEITPLGFSPVPFLVLGGLALLGAFVVWEQRRARLGRDQLLDPTLLRVAQLRAGLSTLLGQQLVLMGTFFVIPVYLQVVLGLDAFETGKRLLPLSVAMLVFALLGPRIAGPALAAHRRAARAGRRQHRRDRDARDPRRDAERHRLQDRARPDRRGRRPARIAARERDHVLGPARQDQRGGRAPGHRPEPRLLARHGDHRRGAARVAGDRLQRARSPTTPTSRRPRARRSSRTPRRGSTSCRWRTSRRPRSRAGSRRTRPQAVAADYGDAQLEALRLALGAVAPPRCCRSGSRADCRRESLADGEASGAEPAAAAAS